ncbi:hypothetical protein ABZ930_30215 [Streptomyces sp. NPDC046716]|uniref:hypothetical protein n=1 Tax=Streptomyces sp. NPDC046716 TaxID=3157093 RepID=UPI00340A1A26
MLDDGTAYVDSNGRSKLAESFETYAYDPQSRLRPGEVYGAQLGGAERDTYVVGEPVAPVEPARRVGLWLPVVSWPLRLPCGGVLLVLLSLVATAGMSTDVAGRGRWGLATAAVVGLLGARVACLRSESGRERRAGREWGSRRGWGRRVR